jgi:hypothetical protein
MADYAFDPSTMQPSATGRTAVTLDDLFSNIPSNTGPKDKSGRPTAKGDPWGDYLKKMQYLTQPPTNAGSDARRAMAGMPAGPKNALDDVKLQQSPAGQSLMALLFGGGGR